MLIEPYPKDRGINEASYGSAKTPVEEAIVAGKWLIIPLSDRRHTLNEGGVDSP